jgi:hypothetical protein
MERKKPVFQEQSRRLGCGGQIVGAILLLAVIYWLFFAPINIPAGVTVPLSSIDGMRLTFRGTVNELTGGFLDQIGLFLNRGGNIFVNFFQNIGNQIYEMVQGICGGLVPTIAAALFWRRRQQQAAKSTPR